MIALALPVFKIKFTFTFITSRLTKFKHAVLLYVSGNELNKIAPGYLKVFFQRLDLGLEG